jgi:Bacterial dnaA protein helix-turn-helix
VAFARQVAMYLAHTGGGISFSEVGRLFARDRTTVAHACALVEDMRDDPAFDRCLAFLELALISASNRRLSAEEAVR